MPIQEFSDNRDVGNLALPQTGQVDYWDRLLPSFGVRVSSGGNKSFVVSTRVNGKFRRFTIKPPFPSIGLAEARAQAVQIIADAQVGVTPQVRKKREEKGTFGAVAADFMRDFAHSHRTRKEMQRKIDVELRDWHDRPIREITRSDIKERLREKARDGGIAANRLLALISKYSIGPSTKRSSSRRRRCVYHVQVRRKIGSEF